VEELKAEGKIQVHKVKEINNLADMPTKQYPTPIDYGAATTCHNLPQSSHHNVLW
jgi:hypothetical protein